jgi:hypothetical protein
MAAITGLRARIVRALQRFGCDGTTLAICVRRSGTVTCCCRFQYVTLTVSASRRCSSATGVHDLGYFGPGTFEQFPILDAG